MKNKIKVIPCIAAFALMSGFVALTFSLEGCSKKSDDKTAKTEILVLAAASLTNACSEIEAEYESTNPDTDLIFSYASSGALQAQIEEGVRADIFISASQKQMDALKNKGLMEESSIKNLLENKLVLVAPENSTLGLSSFEDLTLEKVKLVGLGDPASVPAGQYASDLLEKLGILEEVQKKANYGSDVRAVLSWVETGDVDCGIVYATDAFVAKNIRVLCEAPEGSCKKVVYPAGIIKSASDKKTAENFLEYLSSDKAGLCFSKYGFSLVE